jgi:thiol-disulfide isomerase/thioredoxin
MCHRQHDFRRRPRRWKPSFLLRTHCDHPSFADPARQDRIRARSVAAVIADSSAQETCADENFLHFVSPGFPWRFGSPSAYTGEVMNPRRALVVVVLIGAAALVWVAVRYDGVRRAGAAAAQAGSTERITLHFFRNPSRVQDVAMRDLDGRIIEPASLRGKVALINFWATWCGPCREEIPDLVELQRKYRDQLQVVGVSEDEVGPEIVRRFATERKVNYPIVMLTPELEKTFPGVRALPTSFLLDREGRLVQKHVGMLAIATTEAETRSLAGLPVNATIEEFDQTQGLKLENGAQLTTIPGVDLAKFPPDRRAEALQKLNAQPCTCGCDLTVARCRVDDPSCGVSLPLARQIVAGLKQ